MKILQIFLLGLAILLGAILLNMLASRIGFPSWYEFLKSPSKTKTISYIWLFVLYPLGLGVIAYIATNLLNM